MQDKSHTPVSFVQYNVPYKRSYDVHRSQRGRGVTAEYTDHLNATWNATLFYANDRFLQSGCVIDLVKMRMGYGTVYVFVMAKIRGSCCAHVCSACDEFAGSERASLSASVIVYAPSGDDRQNRRCTNLRYARVHLRALYHSRSSRSASAC